MKHLKILLLFLCTCTFAQNNPVKFEGQIKGIFEVLEIDTSQSVNLIKLKLKYLVNNDVDVPSNYVAFIYSEKLSKKQYKKNSSFEKVKVGKEYYFNLKHLIFYRSLNPPPNTIPRVFELDGKTIWKESDDYGIYTTSYLEGVSYVEGKYLKDDYHIN